LFVLGAAAAISPIAFSMENIIDTIVLIVMTAIVMVFCFKKKELSRVHGWLMLAMYAAYTAYIFIR
jgi:cation:H+ antiporter